MRIAIVTRDLPMPPGTGLNLVIHNLVKGLAGDHEIRFFVLNRGYYNYKVPGTDANAFPWPVEECPADFATSAAEPHLSRATRYYGIQPKMLVWLEQSLKTWGAQRIVGFDFNLAPYLGLLRLPVPKILNAVDSEILYYRNQLAVGNLKPTVVKHFLAATMMGREHFPKLNAVVTVSQADSRNIQRMTGIKSVFTIPNGVDHESFVPNPDVTPRAHSVVFCGSLSFAPNLQAIDWFVANCWKRVLAKCPDAKLVVIGKSPSADLKPRLEAYPGVQCLGYVDDIRRFIQESAVSVAPMVTGSGIKNKILEAWALGTPVVATEVAVRGLTVTNGENILISGSAEGFADQVASVLVNSELRSRLAVAGREHVVRSYAWDKSRKDFRDIVERAG